MMSMTTVVTIRDPRPEWKCSDFAGFAGIGKALGGIGYGLPVSRVPLERSRPRGPVGRSVAPR